MTTPLMTIRAMSELFDITPRTLRFYEAKELIAPLRVGQNRLYGKRDRARLKLILRGKRFGFSLEEMRQLLNLYEEANELEQMKKTYQIAIGHMNTLEQQRDELNEAIAELNEQMDHCAVIMSSMNGQMAVAAQ